MTVVMAWMNDTKSCIIGTFEGRWTSQEFAEAITILGDMLENTPEEEIFIIVDGSQSQGIPKNQNLIKLIQRVFDLSFSHILIVPSSRVTQVILNMITRANPDWGRRITFIRSVDDAIKHINQLRNKVR